MKKKEYMKPTMEVVELNNSGGILMTSGGDPEPGIPIGPNWPDGLPIPW